MRAWILESWPADAGWLLIPGLLATLLSLWIPDTPGSAAYALFAFVTLGLLDSGHVYATLWRTYLNPRERRRTRLYWLVPLAVFALFFAWAGLGIPYLGSFVLYVTLFHNIRQLFGIAKWYQKLNGVYRPAADFFVQALCAVPLLGAHFDPRAPLRWRGYYAGDEVLLHPDPALYRIALGGYALLVAAWLVYEARLAWRERRVEWNRVSAIANAAFLYGFCTLYASGAAQTLFPLLVSHGVAYIGLTTQSVRRVGAFPLGYWAVLVGVALTCAALGTAEFVFEGRYAGFLDPRWAAVTALWLTPVHCHYVFDALLWRRRHPEAGLVFGSSRAV